MELRFKYRDVVWIMHANRPCVSLIIKITITDKVEYHFDKKEFIEEDKNITGSNPFSVKESLVFKTKAELINSL